MPDRPSFQNPNLCIDPDIIEVSNGRGYCSPSNRKFRNEESGCEGCMRDHQRSWRALPVSRRELMTPEQRLEEDVYYGFRKS